MDGDFGHHLLVAVMELLPREEFAIDRLSHAEEIHVGPSLRYDSRDKQMTSVRTSILAALNQTSQTH
jgi:hypothetical protein